MFCKKRLQTIENKGRECRKESKERRKRPQLFVGKRVGVSTGLNGREFGNGEGVHPRGDGKYAQLVDGGGDRVAAWRMQWRGEARRYLAPSPLCFS